MRDDRLTFQDFRFAVKESGLFWTLWAFAVTMPLCTFRIRKCSECREREASYAEWLKESRNRVLSPREVEFARTLEKGGRKR